MAAHQVAQILATWLLNLFILEAFCCYPMSSLVYSLALYLPLQNAQHTSPSQAHIFFLHVPTNIMSSLQWCVQFQVCFLTPHLQAISYNDITYPPYHALFSMVIQRMASLFRGNKLFELHQFLTLQRQLLLHPLA